MKCDRHFVSLGQIVRPSVVPSRTSILLTIRTTRNNMSSTTAINHDNKSNNMEHSENNETKHHAITPHSDGIGAPSDDKRQKLAHRQCDCGLQFCNKGDIQVTLHELNCHELLEFKQVYACTSTCTRTVEATNKSAKILNVRSFTCELQC